MMTTHGYARPVRTPVREWIRHEENSQNRLVITHRTRLVAMRMSTGADEGEAVEMAELLSKLKLPAQYKITKPFAQESLREGNMRRGFVFVLADGRSGFYTTAASQKRNGEDALVSYINVGPIQRQASLHDIDMVRALNNQLRRGATLGGPVMAKKAVDFAVVDPVPMTAPAPMPAPERVAGPAVSPVIGAAPVAPAVAALPISTDIMSPPPVPLASPSLANAAPQATSIGVPPRGLSSLPPALPVPTGPAVVPTVAVVRPTVPPPVPVVAEPKLAVLKPQVIAPAPARPSPVQTSALPSAAPVVAVAPVPRVVPPPVSRPISAPAPKPAPVPAIVAAPQVSVPVAKAPEALKLPVVGVPSPAMAAKGVALTQVAGLLYAPLEASEVYVLFKDGSFHETLPRAFEDWDASSSKRSDPDSWGKWKRGKAEGEFDLRYGPDDEVTISATRVQPNAPGTKLDGEYALTSEGPADAGGSVVRFFGDRFEIIGKAATRRGVYRIEGYTISLAYEDGLKERRPFFFVPSEEAGEPPDIWFGDELRVKV